MPRVLISGFYGHGNAGDEAILAAMLEELRAELAAASFVVTSGAPAATAAEHGVEAVRWNDFPALVAAVRGCDGVVVGGGGLFHDYWPFESRDLLSSRHGGISFSGTVALLATLCGKRLMVYAAGVGPLRSQAARLHTRAVFEQAHAATVRDPESRDLLAAIGVAGKGPEVTADPAFRLAAVPPERVRTLLVDQGLVPDEGPLVGVALRDWRSGEVPDDLPGLVAAAVDAFLERHGGRVLLLPCHRLAGDPADDPTVAAAVRRAMRRSDRAFLPDRPFSPRELAGALAACDLVVAMRYHAALFAGRAGRPLVALAYDHKVRHLMRQLGGEDVTFDLADLTAPGLERALQEVWAQRRRRSARLAAAGRSLARRAQRNPKQLKALLARRRVAAPRLSAETRNLLREAAVELALVGDDAYRRAGAAAAAEDRLRQENRELQEERRRRRAEAEQRAAQSAQRRQRLEQRMDAVQAELEVLAAGVRELERSLLRLRGSRGHQIAKLLVALRWLPWGARLRLLPRLVRRLFQRDLALGLPEGDALGTMDEAAVQLRRAAAHLAQLREEELADPVAELPAATVRSQDPPARPRAAYAMPPRVSVMLPVCNHADLLPAAVASIQAQSYGNWELIVLDDGSTDAIDEVFTACARDPRIRLYRQQNQKLPNALTRLHELATGEFLTWTSADNVLAPEMLDELVAALAEDPGTVMVFGDGALIDDQGRPFVAGGYRDHNRDGERPEWMRLPRHVGALGEELDNFINACFLYRAWAARAIGGYAPELACLEDYDFFLRLRRVGRCRHVGNHEPLYYYRVHRRTMSQEVFDTAWEAHLRRGEQLIELDRRRQDWAERRWTIIPAGEIGPGRGERLPALLARLPVDQPPAGGEKILRIVPGGELPAGDRIGVAWDEDGYRVLVREDGGVRVVGEVPAGEAISLLATKARRQRNPEPPAELRPAGDRLCLGAHLSLADIDVDATMALIRAHPELFFAFFDHPDRPAPARGERLREAGDNAACLGPRPFGTACFVYAGFAAVICPPLAEGARRALHQCSLLAAATGRWLLYPATCRPPEGLPFAVPYAAGEPLPPVWRLDRPAAPDAILDRWLDWGSELSCLRRVLRLATAAGQDLFVRRPDFGAPAPPGGPPRPWDPATPAAPGGWIGLWVDTLDKGGLEEVVAMLARELRGLGREVRILCSQAGGRVADRLRGEGLACEIFHGDGERFAAYLEGDPPGLLNSHFTRRLYDVPARLGIPVVETIHNMYVFLGSAQWVEERARSRHYARAIAVSETVRDYYLRWHGDMHAGRVTVIPNAADPARTGGLDRRTARRLLGYDDRACVFLNLACFDPSKNQLGLVTAFDRLWAGKKGRVALLLMGNPARPAYRDRLAEHLATLACREAVQVLDYRADVGSVLAAADAMVLASYFEGWSIAGTEALYAGLPLIHTACGGGGEMCADGRGILIANPGGDPLALSHTEVAAAGSEPPNTLQLVAALAAVEERLAQWRRRRPELRSAALRRFSLRQMAGEYLRIFDEVMGGQPDRS
ncbi:MAG: glycosyltransferase [bacterium]|nr:glycosyltransferase [bacterium]